MTDFAAVQTTFEGGGWSTQCCRVVVASGSCVICAPICGVSLNLFRVLQIRVAMTNLQVNSAFSSGGFQFPRGALFPLDALSWWGGFWGFWGGVRPVRSV